MRELRRRAVLAVFVVIAIVLSYTLLYRWAMWTFEGEPRSVTQSLQVVVEILTTAGFGGDTDHWSTPVMNLLVVAMNLTGVVLVFLALPIFVFPMLQEALGRPLPRSSDMTEHVLICGYSHRDEVLIEELQEADIPYLFVEDELAIGEDLLDRGQPVMIGDIERAQTFRDANAEEAVAVVADAGDERNPTVLLSAARINPDLTLISVVREAAVAPYHRLAGADAVVEAPLVLGESLGSRAVSSFAETFHASVEVTSKADVTELLIEEGSELVGQSLRDIEMFGGDGATVVGGWFEGKFVISPDPDIPIEPNTILLVIGPLEDDRPVRTRTLPSHEHDPDRVVVCGYGVVGAVIVETIEAAGFETTVIDQQAMPGVDIVGDVTDSATLEQADLEHTRTIVLSLDRDPTTIFTTLVLREMVPDLEIIARVHEPDNVWKVYSAGADFAVSMSTITGEMLASLLIEDREIIMPQAEFEFLRTTAPAISGDSLAESNIRRRTGCTVVAVERNEKLLTDIGPDFVIESDDVLVVAGLHDQLGRFMALAH